MPLVGEKSGRVHLASGLGRWAATIWQTGFLAVSVHSIGLMMLPLGDVNITCVSLKYQTFADLKHYWRIGISLPRGVEWFQISRSCKILQCWQSKRQWHTSRGQRGTSCCKGLWQTATVINTPFFFTSCRRSFFAFLALASAAFRFSSSSSSASRACVHIRLVGRVLLGSAQLLRSTTLQEMLMQPAKSKSSVQPWVRGGRLPGPRRGCTCALAAAAASFA